VSENEEPGWPAELVPIVRAVDQFVRDARLAKASGGPALPIVQRVALAVDATMREILPARLDATARPATVEVSVAFLAVIVGTGGVTLPRIRISGQGKVQDRRAVIAGQVLIMVILWLLVLVGPAAIMKANLSSGATTMLDAYYGAIAAIAVAVTTVRGKSTTPAGSVLELAFERE
jgi:hypothetical protein